MNRDNVSAQIADFVRRASIEITPPERTALDALASRLPAGSAVYVTHTPKAGFGEIVEASCDVERHGLSAVPHVAARRIRSESELVAGLERLRAHGIGRAMLVAGDVSKPAGPYASTFDLLESGKLAAAGIDTLGVAGHPEGHARVAEDILWDALRRKQEYARTTGARMHVVTQFGFDPGALISWERGLTGHGITLPVHVGIAGPASFATLARYAVLCGIGASVAALAAGSGQLRRARRLVKSGDQMLLRIVRLREGALARRFVQPHFFAFGGALQTAEWLAAMRAGRFDIDERAGSLAVHG